MRLNQPVMTQRTYQPRIPLDNLNHRVLTTIRLLQTLQDTPSTKQTLSDGQDTIKNTYIDANDQTPGHKLYQTLQKHQMLTDGQDTNNRQEKNATDHTT